MTLLPRIALGLLGLSLGSSLACQMTNPAFDLGGDSDETRGNADTLEGNSESNSESSGSNSTGDGDPSTGDGDPSTGDGDPNTGDGDPTTGDGDPTTGDGDSQICGDGIVDPGEECDDGNSNDGDGCSGNCTVESDSDSDSGDGDGDDGGIKLDMMLAEECMVNLDPVTCEDCVSSLCCFPAPMDCLDNPKCLCVVDCLLGGQNGEIACFQQICQVDGNDAALIDEAFPCIEDHCAMQCQG
jgi:cysteine-rich repeat protein